MVRADKRCMELYALAGGGAFEVSSRVTHSFTFNVPGIRGSRVRSIQIGVELKELGSLCPLTPTALETLKGVPSASNRFSARPSLAQR
jgi:hypothetical protein